MDINLFRYDPEFTLIAVTGGPCGGKSSFLARARQWLEDHNLKVAVLSEGATDFITSGISPFDTWKEPSLSFQEQLLLYNLERENRYYTALRNIESDKPRVLLCDRGVLDALAYVGRDAFLEVIERHGFDLHELRERYSAVVHMVTAADGAEEYYTLANNEARSESPEVARALDQRTQGAWLGHQHLSVIDNRTGFQEKLQRALSALARILNMPEPREIERKFRLLNFRHEMIPQSAVAVGITQTYLKSDSVGAERRVRRRELDGSSSYYYTEKVETSDPAVRIEREREITRREYEALLVERDPERDPVRKMRYSFSHNGQHLELDVYSVPIQSLAICEVELRDREEEILLPREWVVEEVTSDTHYRNSAIARGSLS